MSSLTREQQRQLEQQLEVLLDGAVEVVPVEALKTKLTSSIVTGKPLKVKLGLDPTAPDIHLGHTVVIRKLKQFQDFGHRVQLVIGDFTGRIGDPTGRSEARRQMSEAEVRANAQTYVEQYGKILDIEKTELHFNSEWLSPLTFADVVRLSATMTLARMLERDDFRQRFQGELPISLHEFFYPLMQGYDSVALETDIEIGGTDQTFNLLMGRNLQREYGQEPQVVMTFPLLEGLDGVQKMSKSLGNYIGISERPEEMYGKVMSIADELMVRYYQLLTGIDAAELKTLQTNLAEGLVHPRDAKLQLAHTLVQMYHGREQADKAAAHFEQVFQNRSLPEQMPEFVWQGNRETTIVDLLTLTALVETRSQARRLIAEGAVRLNGAKITDTHASVWAEPGLVVQVGRRRFLRISSQES